MLHPLARKTIPWALSAALAVGTVPPQLILAAESGSASAAASAATTVTPVFSTPAIGKVSLGGSSFIELKDVQQLGRTVRFTVSLYNGGSTDLQFIDYWVRLRSTAGSQFSPTLFAADKDKNRIAPKTTETFAFYASVSDTTKLSDLTFDIIKWDFSVSSFQRTLGSLKVPATYQPSAPAGSVLSTAINGVSAKAQIKRVNIAKTSDKYTASLVFEFENTGSKSFTIPAYEYAIVTSEGLTYPLTVSGLPANASLHPRFKEDITLRGELPASLENKNWKLVLSEKQGESLTVPSLSFFLPSSTAAEVSDSVAIGEMKELLVSDQKIEAKITRTVRNENDRNFLAAIRFSFKNQGSKSVVLPKYTFQIETSSGLTYPVTADMSNVSIDPLVEREVELRATLPNSVGKDGWKLLLNGEGDGTDPNSQGSALAKFDLSNDNPAGLNQGATYAYSNESGTYSIQFENVQRLPWEDEDILSASFKIRNPGTTSLPVPELVGYFILDDKIRVEATTLQKDTVLAVKPNGTISVQLYGKVPYTYEYSDLKVFLQEKTGDSATEVANIVDFRYTGKDATKLPVVNIGQKHKIEGVGRASEVAIRDVRTYEGSDSTFFTTLVDVKNLEKRFASLTSLVGYFATPDGLMFPATISEAKDKVSPQSVATLLFSTSLPNYINTNTVKLIVGEGVINGKFAEAGQSDAYVNAISFNLPNESTEPKNTLTDLMLFPYTVSLTNVSANLVTTESFMFNFNYNLTKNTFVDTIGADHQLLIEFVDSAGSTAFSKQFTLGKATGVHEEDSSDLALGIYSKSFEITDKLMIYKIQNLTSYKIKVYDLFMNQKYLLAEQSYNW